MGILDTSDKDLQLWPGGDVRAGLKIKLTSKHLLSFIFITADRPYGELKIDLKGL